MERMIKALSLVAVALLLVTVPVEAQPTKSELKQIEKERQSKMRRMEVRIDELEQDLAESQLEYNRLVIEKLVARSEKNMVPIKVFELKTFNAKELYDAVPSIAELNEKYKEAYDSVTEVMKTDSEYEDLHNRWVAAKGNDELRKELSKEYNLLYERLKSDNPDYQPARRVAKRAEVERNAAIARYLLNGYQANGELMPTEPFISRYDLSNMTNSDMELSRVKNDIDILQATRNELKKEYAKVKYELSDRKCEQCVKSEKK